MPNQDLNKLYVELNGVVPKKVITNKNRAKSWLYGYNPKYDIVVISRSGEIGSIIEVNNLKIALPKTPKLSSKQKPEDQYWEPHEYPKDLSRIKSIFQWHETPADFKSKWVDYIEQ